MIRLPTRLWSTGMLSLLFRSAAQLASQTPYFRLTEPGRVLGNEAFGRFVAAAAASR